MLTIRAEGIQPLPVLIFRGTPTHLLTRKDLIAKRAVEEGLYSKHCRVMWQKCAWADTEVMERWAGEELKGFLQEMGIEDSLLLADNLNAQCAPGFRRKCREAGARLWLGPKDATHIWQPADHHVGAAYKKKMGDEYDDFMIDDIDALGGKVSTPQVRVLLMKWAGEAYLALEKARRVREAAREQDPKGDHEPSLFYGSFMSTGNLVTRDGTHDDKIKPHKGIVDELEVQFRGLLHEARPLDPMAAEDGDDADDADAAPPEDVCAPFIIVFTDSSGSDSEDLDDEWQSEADLELAEADRDRARLAADEELDFEVEEEDEEAEIRGARAMVRAAGNEEELHDFNVASYIARQQSVAVAPEFTGARDKGYNTRKNAIYKESVAAYEAAEGKSCKGNASARLWEEAAIAAMEENPLESSSSSSGVRPRTRARRKRN
jgi:hypothetical protein